MLMRVQIFVCCQSRSDTKNVFKNRICLVLPANSCTQRGGMLIPSVLLMSTTWKGCGLLSMQHHCSIASYASPSALKYGKFSFSGALPRGSSGSLVPIAVHLDHNTSLRYSVSTQCWYAIGRWFSIYLLSLAFTLEMTSSACKWCRG